MTHVKDRVSLAVLDKCKQAWRFRLSLIAIHVVVAAAVIVVIIVRVDLYRVVSSVERHRNSGRYWVRLLEKVRKDCC